MDHEPLEFQDMSSTDSFDDCFVTVHKSVTPPEISVVMPIYNCAEFVESAVTSILAQQHVTAEIIISDDASTDDTFARALATVQGYITQVGLTHTVRMRRGTQRLARDHLHLLAATATSDLVCQAHGDDVSHCYRCTALVEAFESDPTASMIFVNSIVIDHKDRVVWAPPGQISDTVNMVPAQRKTVIDAKNEQLVGSNMAWRPSAFQNFEPLSTEYSAYGHDRVMTFRSFLLGTCYILEAPLLKRRLHADNFHKELLKSPNGDENSFNAQRIKLTLWNTMKKDLICLQQKHLIDPDQFDQYTADINDNIIETARFLVEAQGRLLHNGHVNKWHKQTGS